MWWDPTPAPDHLGNSYLRDMGMDLFNMRPRKMLRSICVIRTKPAC